MREHALPQDVTGYKFHIIGNMTLKQFVEVGAGFVIAFLIFQTNLPNLVKWPLMAMSAGIGAMLAFVPIEERPLDQWLTALFRALYRPTQYYWKRANKIPEPFLYEAKKDTKSVVGEIDLSPARRQRVKEYLRSIDTVPEPDQFETYSSQRVDEVMQFFQNDKTQQHPSNFSEPDQQREDVIDQLSFAGRAQGVENQLELDTVGQASAVVDPVDPHAQEVIDMFNNAATSEDFAQQVQQVGQVAPVVDQLQPSEPLQAADVQLTPPTAQQVQADATQAAAQISSLQAPQIQVHNIFDAQPQEAVIGHIIDEEGSRASISMAKPQEPATPAQPTRREIVIPEIDLVQVNKSVSDQTLATGIPAGPTQVITDTTQVGRNEEYQQPQIITNLQQVAHNANLPFPNKPDMPNKVVGMVIDTANTPVPNAIVEILTQTGLPARAVKTNMLGQFFITTPLNVGEYVIRVDKDGLQFIDSQLSIQNQIIEPLELRAV